MNDAEKARFVKGSFDRVGKAQDLLKEIAVSDKQHNFLEEVDKKWLEESESTLYALFESLSTFWNDYEEPGFKAREKKQKERGVIAMNKQFLEKLMKISDGLDKKGFYKEASELDGIIKKMAKREEFEERIESVIDMLEPLKSPTFFVDMSGDERNRIQSVLEDLRRMKRRWTWEVERDADDGVENE